MDPKTIQLVSAKLCIFNNILNGEQQINKVLVTVSDACIYSILNGTLSGCVAGPCRLGLGIAHARICRYLAQTGVILYVISRVQPRLALKVMVTLLNTHYSLPRLIPFIRRDAASLKFPFFYLFYLLLCNVLWSIFYFHQDFGY